MEIQIRHDETIPGNENLADRVRTWTERALERFDNVLTVVNIHLADENGPKRGGNEYRCSIEAHAKGMRPLGVTHRDTTFELAVQMAADKMARLLDTQFGRLRANHDPLNSSKPLAGR